MIAALCVLTSLLPGFGNASEPLKLRLELLDGSTKEVTTSEVQVGPDVFFGKGSARLSLTDLASVTPEASGEVVEGASAEQHFYLTDGSEFNGKMLESPGHGRTIRVEMGLDTPLDIPLQSLRAVRFRAAESGPVESEFQDRVNYHPIDKDLLIVSNDEKPVVLPGALEKLSPSGWEFTIGRKTQRQSLDAAYGLVLGGLGEMHPQTNPQIGSTVRLRSEALLVGSITSASERGIHLANAVGLVSIDWGQIAAISIRSSRVVYLAELTPAEAKCTSVLDVDFPFRRNTSVTGTPISLRGQAIARGIGAHARSRISYKLDKQYDRLLTTIGIDDDAAPVASAVFRVLAYGKVIYESPVLRRDDPPKQINVPLDGAREITLECDDGGDSDVADHCDWGDVRVIGLPAIH